jgi:Zn-dependent protease/predicted transcriptional regulator
MNNSINLFRLFGIKVKIHITFLLLPLLIGLGVLYSQGPLNALRAVIFIFFIFTCVTFHELTHSLVAQHFKIKVRSITLLPIGGVASMEKMPDKPKEEFLMAVAGPMFNIVLAAVLFYPLYLFFNKDLAQISPAHAGFQSWKATILYMYWVNPILAVFNLVPAFPMDGGRALRALLASRIGLSKATRIAVSIGHVFAVIFGILGFMGGNIFLIVIAFFVYMAASQEEKMLKVKLILGHYSAKDIISNNYLSLKPKAKIAEALELSIKSSQQDFPVIQDEKVLGILTRQDIITAVHEHDKNKLVEEVMSRDYLSVGLNEHLTSLYNKMATSKLKTALVFSRHQLKGIISLEDISRVYNLEAR